MKKRSLVLLAAGLSMALFAAACGKKDTTETTAAAAETQQGESSTAETTPAETVSADDPEIKALSEQEVPAIPKLSEMGSISLPDLSTIEVSAKPESPVTDEEVDSQIQVLLSADLQTVEADAADGDTVNIDYVGTMDGVAFDGGTASGYDLKLGSGTFIAGFEDQLIGSRAGEKITVKVTFPQDYGNADLAGKPAEFAVTVNAVKRAPELTDEWVKNYEETEAQTVEEFKSLIRTQLQAGYDYSYHAGIQQQALSKIVDAATIELSDAMQDYGTAYVLHAQLTQMQQYGFDLASMINMYGMTVDAFKEEMAAEGAEYAKQYFVIQQIAADQDITLTDELLNELVENISAMAGKKYTKLELMDQFGQEMVEAEAINDAVMDYIESQIKVTVGAETEAETAASESAAG